MTIEKIKTLLNADILYGEDALDREVQYAFSSRYDERRFGLCQ